MEQVKNEQTIYSAAVYCRLSKDDEQAGHPEEHNRILLAKIRELDQMGYDAIVMAQVSMRALLPALTDVKTPLLCSFYSGYSAIADALNKIAELK